MAELEELGGRLAALLGLERNASDSEIVGAVRGILDESATEDGVLLRSIVEYLPAMLFVKDAENLRFVHFNRAGEAMLGVSREDLIGRNDYDLFTRQEAEGFIAKDREVLANGGVHDIEAEPIHTMNGVRWLHTQKIPIVGDDGTPLYLLGISQDITDARAAAEALGHAQLELRASTSKVQMLLRRFPGGVWTTDGDLRITSTAGAMLATLGLLADDSVGAHVGARLATSVLLGAVLQAHERALDGQVSTYDMASGSRTFEVRVEPRGEPGQGVIGVALDVTARRQAQAEKMQTELERTQKLKTLGLLAGGIAHDFNNILASILGNAGLALTMLPPDTAGRGAVERIERAAEAAAELTGQMLAYSGRGQFLVEPVDVSGLVADTAEFLRLSVGKEATFEQRLMPGLPMTKADRGQIRQLVLNLLTNASDALEGQPGTIRVTTGVVHVDEQPLSGIYLSGDPQPGRYVTLEISDTGCGMDDETQHRMFDPFFTTKAHGHGLGLSASLGIVIGHGGAIRVDSEVGAGTTIRVLLPVSTEEAVAAVAASPTKSHSGGRKTILCADDEPDIRTFLELALEAFGFEVLLAKDGVECLEVFKAHQDVIDAVLLDLTMPRMSGEDTFRALLELDPSVQVLLTSGYSERDATSRFDGPGPAAFIQKPFPVPNLIAQLEAIVGTPTQ